MFTYPDPDIKNNGMIRIRNHKKILLAFCFLTVFPSPSAIRLIMLNNNRSDVTIKNGKKSMFSVGFLKYENNSARFSKTYH
jgi:hypothetical protein